MEKYAQKNIKAILLFMHFCCRTLPGVRGLKLCAYLDGITLQTLLDRQAERRTDDYTI